MQDSDQIIPTSAALPGRVFESTNEARKAVSQERASKGQDEPMESEIIGSDGGLSQLLAQAERVAPLPITVLITGESGTGKELLAQRLHRTSPRRNGRLVIVNCAALPEALLESELFGHEKGAFTGALCRKEGKFERAHGGTLFLDEIGELPACAQPKLLRALQDKAITRLGGHESIAVDVRFVVSTNRRLEEEIARGSFREDLYYRLKVVELHCPPLRERKGDIPALAQHFLNRYGKLLGKQVQEILPTAMQRLYGYDWPGNIRELENVIARAVAFATTSVLGPQDLGLPAHGGAAEASPAAASRQADSLSLLLDLCGLATADLAHNGFDRTMRACERICLQGTLARVGNQKRAAQALDLSPSRLHRLIKKHGLKSFKSGFQN